MREFIVVSFLLFSATTFGQTIKLDSLSGKYQSEGIVHVDSLTKESLFSKAQEWIALNYKSAQDVIQLADKENAKIILKGNFTTSMFMKEGYIGHTLILEFKDGRFRYTYTDFSYESMGSGKMNFESKNLEIKIVQEFGEGLPEHRRRCPKEIDSPQTVEISNCYNETDELSRIYFICCECNGVKTNHFEVIIKYTLI